MMIATLERLKCPVDGAAFVKKLVQAQAQQNLDPSLRKKRPVVADLSEPTQPKKKAKSKAKAATKPAAKASSRSQVLQDGETEETLQQDICMDDSSLRPRRWLDDVLSAITTCSTVMMRRQGQEPPTALSLLEDPVNHNAMRVALEFGISGEVVFNKKKFNAWSKLRPALQGYILSCFQQGLTTLPRGKDAEEILQKLMIDASRSNRTDEDKKSSTTALSSPSVTTAVAFSKSALDSKEALKGTQDFLKNNNDKSIQSHAAYRSYLQRSRIVCCDCGTDMDAGNICQFHDLCGHTIADLMTGLWDVMDNNELAEDEPSGSASPILPCVGTSVIVQAAHLAAEQSRVKKANEVLGSGADEEEVKSKLAALNPLEVFGKDIKFLLHENKDAPGELFFNENLSMLLVTCRARYLLAAAADLMCRPKFNPAAERSPENRPYIAFDDIKEKDVPLLHMVLKHLSEADSVATAAGKFMMMAEARYAFQQSPDRTDVGVFWREMWTRALTHVHQAGAKLFPKSEFRKDGFDIRSKIDELLPSAERVCPKSLFGKQAESSQPDGGDGKSIKVESAPVSSASPAADLAELPGLPSFQSIYSMSAIDLAKDKGGINVIDILVLKSSVAAYIFTKAKFLGPKKGKHWVRTGPVHTSQVWTGPVHCDRQTSRTRFLPHTLRTNA